MSSLVYFNGILMPEKEVILPLTDRSYLYGEGLFETIKATNGFIPFLSEHLNRFYQGISTLQFRFDISRAKLEFAVYQTLFHNHLKNAYIRLNLSRENEELGSFVPSEKTNLIIFVKSLRKQPPLQEQEGASVIIFKEFCLYPDRFRQVKSTNYLRNLWAHERAKDSGADEALMINAEGRLVEGATSNFFIHDGEKWITPSLEEGLLPGVTRRVLIDLMKKSNIRYEERPLEITELRKAQEAFLCNSIREIRPLTRVDSFPIHEGQIGEETRRLIEVFQEEIQFRFEEFESKRWGLKESI